MQNVNSSIPDRVLGRPYLPFLDGIRGLAALYVMIHHFMPLDVKGLPPIFKTLTSPFLFGHFMVGVFIVLSGFSLTLPIASGEKEKRIDFKNYIVRRAKRIIPPYYAALFFSTASLYLLSQFAVKIPPTKNFLAEFTWGDFSSYLFLVHNWKLHSVDINRTFWSIASEWQIYFFLPLILLPLWRIHTVLLLVVSLILGLLPVILMPNFNLEYTCPWYLFLFSTGMSGAFFYQSQGFSDSKWPSLFGIFGTLSGALYLFLKIIDSHYTANTGIANLQWLKDIAGGGIAWFFIMFCCHQHQRVVLKGDQPLKRSILHLPTRLLQSQFAIWLGSFSYSLYLTHEIVLVYLRFLNAYWNISPLAYFFIRLGIGMPIAIGFAMLFFQCFEKPFLHRKLRHENQVLPAAFELAPRP